MLQSSRDVSALVIICPTRACVCVLDGVLKYPRQNVDGRIFPFAFVSFLLLLSLVLRADGRCPVTRNTRRIRLLALGPARCHPDDVVSSSLSRAYMKVPDRRRRRPVIGAGNLFPTNGLSGIIIQLPWSCGCGRSGCAPGDCIVPTTTCDHFLPSVGPGPDARKP